jgi:hypothetical protein
MRDARESADAILWLMSPAAIRCRCQSVLDAGQRGELAHFAIDEGRLDDAADVVVELTRERFPALDVPMHSRWRHFAAGGPDRWQQMAAGLDSVTTAERARIRIDLVTVSVLLDAGAGAEWRYRDAATGELYARSEGLALASLDLFASGALSARDDQPLRADAEALTRLDDTVMAEAFQIGADNALVGFAGRTAMLRRLGEAMRSETGLFGNDSARIGNLYDYFAARAAGGRLPATAIFGAVVRGFSGVWPRRVELDGFNLGDVGRHPAAKADGPTDGLVPFHKLSLWLTYSLLEPLAEAGLGVTGLDALPGLAEYRNGGLLIDSGVLQPRHDAVLGEDHVPESELVVEWRALTVPLLDRLADLVRGRLGLTLHEMPLVKVLEGGTWSAGRRLAAERRDGAPPIRIISDGTIF